IKETKNNLKNLVEFTIAYYEGLLKKYGKGRERKTEIKPFESIQARQVAIANVKLYVNRSDGFIGTGLKKDEYVADCSDLDEIIAFTRSGKMKVVKVADKVFIGKDIIHVDVFRKNDERTTYNMIYTDGKSGISFAKRFNVTGITREKEYDLTKGTDRTKVQYFTANPNGEAEVVRILLSPSSSARNKELEFYFETLDIKGRNSIGNQVTKYPIRSVRLKEAGKSTLSGIKLWFDDGFGRLNTDGKGQYLGVFTDEKILVIYEEGSYELRDTEMNQRFDTEKIVFIEKFDPEKIITAIYYDNDKLQFTVKRFYIETSSLDTRFTFIKEGKGNRLETVTTADDPVALIKSGRGTQVKQEKLNIGKFIDVTGWKAIGTKLADFTKSTSIEWVQKKTDKEQPELFD